jgi:hypothetical protein
MHQPNSDSRISATQTPRFLKALVLASACLGPSACLAPNGRTESHGKADAAGNLNDAGTLRTGDAGRFLRAVDDGGLDAQDRTAAILTTDAGGVALPDRLAAARKRLHAYSGADTLVGRDDLDGDGVPERWSWGCGGGSGFGGCGLSVARAGSRIPFSIEVSGSFGSFLQVAPVSPDLAARPKLLQGMIELDFGPTKQRRLETSDDMSLPLVDGSLAWLVGSYAPENQKAAVKPFKSVQSFSPRWDLGAPELPTEQVVLLSEASLAPLAQRFFADDFDRGAATPRPADHDGKPFGLLVYLAHNHGAMKRGASCGDWTVYHTKHGVAVHDTARNKSEWIFVKTDVVKLRWESIDAVKCGDRLVFIEYHIAPLDGSSTLVVIDPVVGRLGEMTFPYASAWKLTDKGLMVGRRNFALDDLHSVLTAP